MSETGGKIYITISDERGEGGSGGGSGEKKSSKKKKKSEKDKLLKYAEHEFVHFVKQTTQQSVSFTISQIGNITGQTAVQRNVENALTTLNALKDIGVAVYMGAKTAGPYGAAIAGAVAIAGTTLTGLMNVFSLSIENRKVNYELGQLRKRAGLDSTYDGSRGTEN